MEGQEERLTSRQPRTHLHVVLTDGEVDERPALEREQRLRFASRRVFRQPVPAILPHRVVSRLFEFAFQLRRRHRNPVDEQHQIDAPVLADALLSHGRVFGMG